MTEDTIRVLRVLEYIGPRAWIEKTLEDRAIKSVRRVGPCMIREAIIGQYPEILENSRKNND